MCALILLHWEQLISLYLGNYVPLKGTADLIYFRFYQFRTNWKKNYRDTLLGSNRFDEDILLLQKVIKKIGKNTNELQIKDNTTGNLYVAMDGTYKIWQIQWYLESI